MREDFTRHQQGIIKRYYDNFDAIQVQKLAELVTELYLAEGKKKEKLWKSAAELLKKLAVPDARAAAIVAKQDPAQLAVIVKEMQG